MKKTKPLTNSEKQAAFVDRMNSKGFVRACEWVPHKDREILRDYCKHLCDKYTGKV